MSAARSLEFGILGPLEASRGGSPLALGGSKQRAVLALLLVHRNRAVSTDVLVESLWPSKAPGRPDTAIQVYVSRLRKLLEPERQAGANPSILVTEARSYRLRLEPGQLDADRFENLLGEGRDRARAAEAEAAAETLAEALALWRGAALTDFAYESWAQPEIGRLGELRLACVEERISADLDSGRQADLVGELEALIAEHPLRERLRALLMLSLYRSGRQAEAVDAFASARATLVGELGIDPSPELKALHQAILNQDVPLARAPRQADVPDLPTPATPLVGRKRERVDIANLVSDPSVRLVTLTGPGGVGKTRLTIEVAAALSEHHRDGVHFVDLAPLEGPEQVAAAVAHTIGVREEPGEPLLETLKSHLRRRSTLLVFDNFEHVLGAAPLVSELLGASGGLNVLVTSRERLHLYGEHEFPLEPLSVPPPEQQRATDELAAVESVSLLLARARAADARFELTGTNAGAVADICVRLDGLPLAIELAAARLRHLEPAELLAELDRRPDVLGGGPVDVAARHQTMQATIDWSRKLLDAEEQRLFRQLAVFVGGWTRVAAEEVCDARTEGLFSLVDKSLVREEKGRGSDPRFSMLQTVRDHALEQAAASGEAQKLRERHLRFFAAFAEEAHGHLRGAEKTEWLHRLRADLENLRSALRWTTVDDNAAEMQLRLAAALRLFWDAEGSVSEGLEWIERGLAQAKAPPERVRCDAYIGASAFASQLRDLDKALGYDAKAVEAARELGDPPVIAIALMRTGIDRRQAGDLREARSYYEQARELAQDAADDHLTQAIVHNLGDLALYEGDFVRARTRFGEALELARARSDAPDTAYALANIALASLKLGDSAAVLGSLQEALTILASISWPVGLAYTLELSADALASHSDAHGAAQLFAVSELMRERLEVAPERFEQELRDERLAAVSAALGTEAFISISEQGRALDDNEAVRYALERITRQNAPSRRGVSLDGTMRSLLS
jgi:predicted ATPase/DNA-binding SARP family transcriptional activator